MCVQTLVKTAIAQMYSSRVIVSFCPVSIADTNLFARSYGCQHNNESDLVSLFLVYKKVRTN